MSSRRGRVAIPLGLGFSDEVAGLGRREDEEPEWRGRMDVEEDEAGMDVLGLFLRSRSSRAS